MGTKFVKNTRASLIPFGLCLLVLTACQSWHEADRTDPEVSMLTSQKVIVLNYLNAGQPDKALKDLRPLLIRLPNDYELNNLMGLTQMALKNYPRALADLRKAYAERSVVTVGLNLSSALIQTGNFKEATTLLNHLKKQAVGEYEYPERIEHNLGLAAEKQHLMSEAEKHYQNALEENPTFYMSLMALGTIYAQTKRETMATQKLNLAKESCNSCIEPIQQLVALRLRHGNTEAALQLVETYARQEDLRPDDKQAAKSLMAAIKHHDPRTARLP